MSVLRKYRKTIEKTTKLDNKYFLPSHIVIKSLNNKYKQIEKIQ